VGCKRTEGDLDRLGFGLVRTAAIAIHRVTGGQLIDCFDGPTTLADRLVESCGPRPTLHSEAAGRLGDSCLYELYN
jgi:hypothetical protein